MQTRPNLLAHAIGRGCQLPRKTGCHRPPYHLGIHV